MVFCLREERKGGDNVSDKEKVHRLTEGYMLLSEEGKQYVLAVVDALAYAANISQISAATAEKKKENPA